MHRVAETTLHQLCRLSEGFWQRAPRESVAHPSGLWDATADYRHHPKLLQQIHMQSKQQRNQLSSEDWRQTRLYNVGDALQHDHWLGNEAHKRRSITGHQMDPLLNAVGPRFCRWSSLDLPYSPTHAGKYEEQGVTSRTLSTRPETPSECSTMCVGHLSTAKRPSWRSTKVVWCQPYYTALNAGGW